MSVERPLQPPHHAEREPRNEDDAYDDARQRRLDEEMERDYMREAAQERAITATLTILGVSGEAAKATLRVLYQLGYMDGTLQASREYLL